MQIINSIGLALFTSFSMLWEILWPLILGFTLSGIVQALVSHQTMELLFSAWGIVPQNRNIVAITEGIQWNYTTILNILFLILAAVMVMRFISAGGIPMLRMMNRPASGMAHHEMS
jgi:uncharacterized protein